MTFPTGILANVQQQWRRILLVGLVGAGLGIGGWWAIQNGWLTGQATEANAAVSAAPALSVYTEQPISTAPAVVEINAVQPTANAVSVVAEAEREAATLPMSLLILAGVDGAQLWDDAGNLVAVLDSGAKLRASARSEDGVWLAVTTEIGDGWVQANDVIAFDLTKLSTMALPAMFLSSNDQTTAESAASAPALTTIATDETVVTTPADNAASPVTATVVADGERLNVRSGPGTDYSVIAKAADGSALTLLGRDAGGVWLQIQTVETADGFGWVSASYLQLDGAVDTLPVVAELASNSSAL